MCGGDKEARVSLPQLCVDSACQPSSLLLLVISIVDKAVHVCLGGVYHTCLPLSLLQST